jgi:hypothetical protein
MPVASMLMSTMSSGGGQGGGGIGQGVANIGGGLLSGITGFFQRRAAKKALAKLSRPQYQIPEEILKTQKMAEQDANEGLPSEQYNKAQQDIQRRQNSAISMATDRRSGLMALPKIQQQSNDASLNLNVADAQARMSNKQRLYGIMGQTAQYRDKAWNINKMQPYERDYNYNMNLLGAGNQNLLAGGEKIFGGVGSLLGAGGGGSGESGSGKSKANGKYITSGQGYVPDGIYMDGSPGYSANV